MLIAENVITGNHNGIFAGGMTLNLIVKDNEIASNSGSGIEVWGSSGIPGNTIVSGNIVKDNGSNGIQIAYVDATIDDNVVSGNNSVGIACRQHEPKICLIKNNVVTKSGVWGIRLDDDSIAKVVNNVSINNSTISYPNHIYEDISAYYMRWWSSNTNFNISFNICDTLAADKGFTWVGNYNAKSDGTAW